MFTLTTHQASTWGYSIIQHPILPISHNGSVSNIGAFTKPILAPNGNMYAINTYGPITINSVVYNSVILKITPGTSNTSTTNWNAATFSYITADGTTNDDNGFGKQNWGTPGYVGFNTGILASNGLIYFPPNELTSWVVFNPTTEKWKITDQYRPTGATSISQYSINSAVLGVDNKIYVLGGRSAGHRGFRITTSTLAANDTIQDSYYDTFSTGSPLGNTSRTWIDSNNTNYTDVATANGTVFKAFGHSNLGFSYNRNLVVAIDVLVHPSGKIFMIPATGRGRIFYIDPLYYGTNREIVSEPAYFVNNYSTNNMLEGGYLILEKPRDANHNPNTLKIYVIPACITLTSGGLGNQLASTYLYVIDPDNKTMSEVDMAYLKRGTAQNYRGIGPKINLPNGHSVVYNNYSGNFQMAAQGGVIISGKDVPSTVTTGANFIKTTDKSIFQEDNSTLANNKLLYFSIQSPGFTGINGSCTPSWPHNGKTIVVGQALRYTEIVSVKGYAPNVTNFNFSERDRSNYTLTDSNLTTLGQTIYNSQFNTPK